MKKPTNLPRGLGWDNRRNQWRISFTSRHTQPGIVYQERLPQRTTRRKAEEYLSKLREDDRLEKLVFPSERQEIVLEKSLTVGDFADTYISWCETHNRPSTVKRKQQELVQIAPWFWDVALKDISPALVSSFAIERKAEGVRSRTVNIGIGQIRHVLKVAHELGQLNTPPPKFEKLPEKDKRPVTYLTHEQADAVLAQAASRGHDWYALVLFLLHTGARYNSEARELTWDDLDLNSGIVRLHGYSTKGGKPRNIPLLPEVITALQNLERRSEYVFTYMANGAHSRYRESGLYVRRLPNGSEIGARGDGVRAYPWDPPEFPHLCVNPHMFRHTFATWRLQSGVSIAIVSKWLGHSSIQITVDTYGHILPEDHVEEIGRCYRPEVKLPGKGQDE